MVSIERFQGAMVARDTVALQLQYDRVNQYNKHYFEHVQSLPQIIDMVRELYEVDTTDLHTIAIEFHESPEFVAEFRHDIYQHYSNLGFNRRICVPDLNWIFTPVEVFALNSSDRGFDIQSIFDVYTKAIVQECGVLVFNVSKYINNQ
jgi:hypothetical protein